MFIRGRTQAEYEYLYAIARPDEPEPTEDYSSLRAIEGYHDGLRLRKEWLFKERRQRRHIKKKTRNIKYRKNLQYMDEFGPYCHEIREFDVKFEPAPVQYSRFFSTNDWSALLVDYVATAFGAKFTLANADRQHAVLNGEDTLTYSGSGGSVAQQTLIMGRALVQDDQEEVVVENTSQLKARGEILTELSSPWIQTKEAAEALGTWITSHWSKTTDQIDVEVFGNPLFEIGDLVAVEYPKKQMAAGTHQYFVTGIRTSFSEGLSTSLTLRRKN
jgi:hypothetical protein